MDSIVSVYSDTRTEYTKQLCIFLIPAYFQFFVDLLTKAKQVSESKKVLWQFQTYLNEIHDWNMEKVHNEINTIHGNTGCDYLEDLLTAVFIAHTKVLTAIRLSANSKKVEITIPKVEHFLFKVLCEISKLLWSSTYLFREDISGVDRQQNYKAIEGIISEGILQAVRSLVPVKSILKNLVNNDVKDDSKDTKDTNDDDSDDDVSINKLDSANSKEPLADLKESLVDLKEPLVDLKEPLADLKEPLADLKSPVDESKEYVTDSNECVEEPNTILSTVKSALNTVAAALPLVELNESPQIINLDEKPSVSFAKYNTLFSSEDPDKSEMVDADESNSSPDLEILDEIGGLSADDCDQLDDDNESSPLDGYEEL